MRDGHDGARVAVQELLQPQHGLGVQVVGGLVKQQQVGSLKQQLAEGHAAALATGEVGHRLVGVRALQGVHGLGELGVQVPAVGGVDLVLELAHLGHEGVKVRVGLAHLLADLVETLHLGDDVAKGKLDVLLDGLGFVQGRLLLQDAHGVAGGEVGLAVGDVLKAGDDLEQRGLAGAVGAHVADLGARVHAHRDVVQNHLVVDGLAGLVELVDELSHGLLAFFWALFVVSPTSLPEPQVTRPPRRAGGPKAHNLRPAKS